jgi:hypothetical protein
VCLRHQAAQALVDDHVGGGVPALREIGTDQPRSDLICGLPGPRSDATVEVPGRRRVRRVRVHGRLRQHAWCGTVESDVRHDAVEVAVRPVLGLPLLEGARR